MTQRIYCILSCLLLWQGLQAQVTLKGVVLDNSTKLPVPYAAVGLKDKPIGTLCDEKGAFELTVPSPGTADSLKVSSIGYRNHGYLLHTLNSASTLTVSLVPEGVQLAAVKVKPGKSLQKVLGVSSYNKANCSAYGGEGSNWKGQESAILIHHPKGQSVYIDNFNFYIIKNKISDSLSFRLNIYKVTEQGMPGENLLYKPIVFKTAVKEGEVHVDLRDQLISTDGDFFVSLECLSDKINMALFCFAGEVSEPSYVRVTRFMKWSRIRGGGLAFNVTASYVK